MKRIYLSLITLIAATGAVFCQSMQTPNIVPPTPDAAKLGEFGKFHGNNAAGVPEISIPLYEIKTPRFNLPISLSYDASGIKVDETATWVGQGWSLNAGGVVTRTIVGAPDDLPDGYLNSGILNANVIGTNFHADSAYLESVIQGSRNTQPDFFFYNFNSQGGKFVFGNNSQPILIPTRPLKISVQPSLAAIQIIDEKGDIYNFSSTEQTTTASNNGGDVVGNYQTHVTSWYLTQMISADKSDTVSFTYQRDPVQANEVAYNFSMEFGTTSSSAQCSSCSATKNISSSSVVTNYRQYQPLHITSILYKGGMVRFVSKTGRQDNTGTASLDSIVAYNYDYGLKAYARLKALKLNTGYFYSNATNQINSAGTIQRRLRLDSVVESSNINARIDAYTFDYNPLQPPPVNNFAQDVWGYYNGKIGNTTLLKKQNIYDASYGLYTIGGADRSSDASYMQAGILTGIHYPTKGYTQFTFEPNLYPGSVNNTVTYSTAADGGNGLGTHEINTTTFTTPALLTYANILTDISAFNSLTPPVPSPPYVKLTNVTTGQVVFQAGGNPNAAVYYNSGLNLLPNQQYQLYAEAKTNPQVHAIITLSFDTTKAATVVGGGLRVKTIKNYDADGNLLTREVYKYGVNESGVGTLISTPFALTDNIINVTNSVGTDCQPNISICHQCFDQEILYNSNSMYELSSLDNSPIAYTTIARYDGDTLQNKGKRIYQYDLYPNQKWPSGSDNNYGVLLLSYPWLNGQLNRESYYRNVNNVYSLVSDKINTYQTINGNIDTGLVVNFSYNYIGCHQLTPYSYNYFNYPIYSGVKLLQQTTETEYDMSGQNALVQKTTNYYHDNLTHLQPTRITTINSKGDNLQQTMVYPQDMVNNSTDPTGVYAAMSNTNMIDPVIKQTNQKNGVQLNQTTTNYYNFTGFIKPITVEFQQSNGPSEIRLNYQSYDAQGNLLTVAQQSGPSTAYQWGYNKAYPVAHASNAKNNDIFYDSFEEGDGNSARGDSKTGHYSHTGPYSKTLTGLDNGNYVLTYWQDSAGIWTLQSSAVNVNTGSYVININTQIDDVRFFPVSALMTTYTYDPVIGVTSSADAKGEITYYEYDGFQRLINIRDKDGNLVKHTDYHYQGQ